MMRITQQIMVGLLCLYVSVSVAQDRLLLNNGKIKKLKGTVVFYDNNSILYQNEKQKHRLRVFEEKQEVKRLNREASDKWNHQQEAKAAKIEKKRQRQQKKLQARRADFEQDVKEKLESLPPVEFEKWKNRELDRIKKLETEQQLKEALEKSLRESKEARKEALQRGRFTSEVSRQRVFSILRADGREEVVYNADTLGIFSDGEPEVEYGVAEMRLYIKGRQDGRKHSFHDVYIGGAVGLSSALLLTYTWDVFYAPIPPAICIAVMAGLRNLKPSPKLEVSSELLQSDPYMDGYIRSARGRKIFAFTMGAIGGLAVGSTAAVLTSPLLR